MRGKKEGFCIIWNCYIPLAFKGSLLVLEASSLAKQSWGSQLNHSPNTCSTLISLFYVLFCSISYVPAEQLEEYQASLGQQPEGTMPLDVFPSHAVR